MRYFHGMFCSISGGVFLLLFRFPSGSVPLPLTEKSAPPLSAVYATLSLFDVWLKTSVESEYSQVLPPGAAWM